MLRTLLASALFAGLIAGLFAAGLQQAFLVPLITEAELYETGQLTHFAGAESATHDHGTAEPATGHDHAAAPAEAGRTVLTVLMTVLTICGFGLITVAGFALAERMGLARIDLRAGLLFGIAGFAATQLMPGLGLSPELPGSAAGELFARQLWWVLTVAATLAGIGLLAWGGPGLKLAGAVVIALPHLVGAPHPEGLTGVVPPELAALFAARALAVGALSWAALGALAGHVWSRETAAG
jgi:cobalt transporter subunit CbtA